MINQPTATDAIGEGFQKYRDLPSNNAYAQLDNMTMAAVGDGMKAAANDKRQEQLDPILKQAGQINAQAAYLEAQMQEEQQSQQQKGKFIMSQATSISELSRAIDAKDTNAINQITQGILSNYKRMSGDESIGGLDHFHNGTMYYHNNETGEIDQQNLEQLIAQSGKKPEEIWGGDASRIRASISPGYQKTYNDTQELQRQQLAMGDAKLNEIKAHTGKIEQEIANPVLNKEQEIQQKLNSDILKDRAAKNYTAVEEKIIPRIEASENMLGIYEGIQGTLENSPDLVGSDWITQVWRDVAVNLGFNPDLDYQKLKSVEFEKMLRPILGAQFGEKEGERILGKFISLDNNPESIRAFLKDEMPKLARNIVKDKQKVEFYSKESHGNLYDTALHSNLDEESEKYLAGRKRNNLPPSAIKQTGQDQNMVTMRNPKDGSTRPVPADQVQIWEQKGAKIVNE